MSLAALARKVAAAQDAAPLVFDLTKACSNDNGVVHLKQLALARDLSKRIAACCGRRAGKSTGIVARAIDVCCSIPGAQVYYCTKSFRWAADTIVEPILKPMLKRAGMPVGDFVHEDLQDLTYAFPNGSRIFFLACDDLGDITKFNGKKMQLCIVDEMQDLREEVLIEFLTVVVKYCLYDYDGTLILAGIPSEAPVGYWFKAWGNAAYTKHSFTAYDNPLRTKEETDAWVAAECAERGVTVEDPLIQRSIFAAWVPMTDWLAYKYDSLKNGEGCRFFRQVTKDTVGWRFAIGVDTGSIDRMAIVVIGQSRRDPGVHLVDEWVTGRGADLDFTAIVNQLLAYRTRYRPTSWFIDPAHAGKPLMAELRNRHGFPVDMAAKKTELKGEVDLVNDGLRRGEIKIPPESDVAADMLMTTWDKDKAATNLWAYSTSHHPDPSEAFRYAYKGIYANWYKTPDTRSDEQKLLDDEAALMDRRAGNRSDDDAGEQFMPENPYR